MGLLLSQSRQASGSPFRNPLIESKVVKELEKKKSKAKRELDVFKVVSSLRSKRFRASSSRTLGREQKKGMTGEGEGREGNACPQTPRFWKTAFAHERSFWMVRCWYCWLLSTRNINQTRYVLFTCVADLVWSYLWSQITNALVWYLFESCLCEGLSDLSPFDQKYNWRSSSGD